MATVPETVAPLAGAAIVTAAVAAALGAAAFRSLAFTSAGRTTKSIKRALIAKKRERIWRIESFQETIGIALQRHFELDDPQSGPDG
jgi:hypothetical protein